MPSDVEVCDMGKADQRLGWGFFWLATGTGAVVALIATAGLLPWAVVTLLIIVAMSFSAAAYYFRLHRAPHPLGTPIRAVILLLVIWGGVGYFGYKIWPKVVIAEPLLYLQPDTAIGQNGAFVLQLANSGPDIDNVGARYEYFVAQKQGKTITIFKAFEFVDVPNPNASPLRTNQRKRINISFLGVAASICHYLHIQKITPLVGVRITVTFRRYSDEKDFSRVWIYGTGKPFPQDAPQIVYQPNTAFDAPGPPAVRNNMLTLSEITQPVESGKWIVPVIKYQNGEIISIN
jgi:hypothetical protein